ncbi:hypothetical protein [Marinirhabdus gelatinilytica]|uniref:DUF1565 domain-containing protein n=1 Tax=Marinirhabdus gelatinilytica TaxID=1703343 RepID=A0A370Q535_9FLAO|nr:hypothetical protein [Marinirhabdus gelatinilytica]RDK83464.1 hypothetical protein C8D94_1071 [Marinirhabdus gelatinilytica]
MRPFIVLLLCFTLPLTAQTTRYVDGINGDNQGGANTCTNAANPCETLSHTLSVASTGDTVEIADAVYTETLTLSFDISLNVESEGGTIIQAATQPNTANNKVITISW